MVPNKCSVNVRAKNDDGAYEQLLAQYLACNNDWIRDKKY